ncbi:Uncharacterised protein [Klebsiella quasipneumoniae]|nr:Uncharacterised protein [Klebsiella quasipneumoniae]
MADNASPKTEPRNQRNTGNNRPLGMVISKLKPLSSEFYTHFHEKSKGLSVLEPSQTAIKTENLMLSSIASTRAIGLFH